MGPSFTGVYILGSNAFGMPGNIASLLAQTNVSGYNLRGGWEDYETSQGDYSVGDAALIAALQEAETAGKGLSFSIISKGSPVWLAGDLDQGGVQNPLPGVTTYSQWSQTTPDKSGAYPWNSVNQTHWTNLWTHISDLDVPYAGGTVKCKDHPHLMAILTGCPGWGGIRDLGAMGETYGRLASSAEFIGSGSQVDREAGEALLVSAVEYQWDLVPPLFPRSRVIHSWFGMNHADPTNPASSKNTAQMLYDSLVASGRLSSSGSVGGFMENASCKKANEAGPDLGPSETNTVLGQNISSWPFTMFEMVGPMAVSQPDTNLQRVCLTYDGSGNVTAGWLNIADHLTDHFLPNAPEPLYIQVYQTDIQFAAFQAEFQSFNDENQLLRSVDALPRGSAAQVAGPGSAARPSASGSIQARTAGLGTIQPRTTGTATRVD